MTNLGIDQLASCDGPASGVTWKNHGESVSAVAFAAGDSCKSLEFGRKEGSSKNTELIPKKWIGRTQRDLAAIQEDGKAGRLKPWKPGSVIYCRAGFERPLQKSLTSTRCKTLNSNRHIFARSASDGRHRTRDWLPSIQARPAPFCTRLDRRVAGPSAPSFRQIHG